MKASTAVILQLICILFLGALLVNKTNKVKELEVKIEKYEEIETDLTKKADTLHSRLIDSVIEQDACRQLLEDHNCGHGSNKEAAEHIEKELINTVEQALQLKENRNR